MYQRETGTIQSENDVDFIFNIHTYYIILFTQHIHTFVPTLFIEGVRSTPRRPKICTPGQSQCTSLVWLLENPSRYLQLPHQKGQKQRESKTQTSHKEYIQSITQHTNTKALGACSSWGTAERQLESRSDSSSAAVGKVAAAGAAA